MSHAHVEARLTGVLSRLDEIESREATRERLRAIRDAAAKDKEADKPGKKKLKPGEKMVFGKVVKVETVEVLAKVRQQLEADLTEARPAFKGKWVKSENLKSGDIFKMRNASDKPQGHFRVASVKKDGDNPAMVKVSGEWKGAPGTGGHHGDFGKTVSLPFERGEEWELVKLKDIAEAKGAEQVACAASGALNLKRGQKGDKKKLAAEVAKRTKSKKLRAAAAKLAQGY